jgi:hypothetical protein
MFPTAVIPAIKNKIQPELAHGIYLQELETMMNWETNGKSARACFVIRLFDVYTDKPFDRCTDTASDEITIPVILFYSLPDLLHCILIPQKNAEFTVQSVLPHSSYVEKYPLSGIYLTYTTFRDLALIPSSGEWVSLNSR